MAYNVISGEINPGTRYYVAGGKSVIYNSITYGTGDYFIGVDLRTFAFSGTGSQEVNEVIELKGLSIELVEADIDQPIFAESTLLNGFSIEYELNEAEKIVYEVTKIQGFALESIDYPFYSFEITETRL